MPGSPKARRRSWTCAARSPASNAGHAFTNRYPSNNAPVLALLQTGVVPPDPVVEHKGDQTVVPQYRCSDARIAVQDMAPIVRAAWMRGVSALPNVFGHESFIDEPGVSARRGPLAFRLRFMADPRARELSEAVAARGAYAGSLGIAHHQPTTPRARMC